MIALRVAGTGSFLPEREITNEDLSRTLDTSDEWIRSRTGIQRRYVLGPHDPPADMGVAAAQAALDRAGLPPDALDLLIVATNVPEEIIPGTAPFIAEGLGLPHEPPFFDIKAGCAGFVFGVAVAGAMMENGLADNALVVGIEALSRFVDWEDRKTCVLFGDGAGAVVLQKENGDRGILGISIHGDATKRDLLRIPAGGVRLPASPETVKNKKHLLEMKGRGVYQSAVQMMERATVEAAQRAGISLSDIDWLLPHQANLRIIEALVKRLGFPRERVLVNIERVANTSTASIPILLDEAVRDGVIREGHILALTAFGAGACYGTVILKW
ncbi:ketoacyl-ACP synthase III [Candidatus Bipolaricaulota bacterium]|nr:ketoacyl-ACP synthase III [Candidatus Bipolaricaulota bacterium]